ncbi:MAG TPA: ADP-ribosylation factor-like protein [Candidatus Deferrimicrobium sp.]|nr:ADP-ribosylation factor-like protein [Candidatus Deferrimicrobium sp.]
MIPDASSAGFQIKCIFAGLDDGGKTSLLLTLEKKILRVLKIKPTRKIEISDFHLLGIPVKIWDMGGQKNYRNEYLTKPHYFSSTKLLFYVIDVQNRDKFDNSIKYFEAILNTFVFLELSPKVIVLLHKSDPDIKYSMNFNRNIYIIRRQLATLPNAKNIAVYQTSIYRPNVINNLFIKELFKIIPGGYKIQELLTQFMKDMQADAIQLIGENLLTIAEAYTTQKNLDICCVCGRNLATMAKELKEMNCATPSRIGIEMDGWLFFKYVLYLETCFYLIFFTKTQESLKVLIEILPQFLKDLSTAMDYIG